MQLVVEGLDPQQGISLYYPTAAAAAWWWNPERYLNKLLAANRWMLERDECFIGWQVVTAGVPHPERMVAPRASLIKAIRETLRVKVA